ncbi:MAG: hypothetical protein J1E39_08575 [Eubacterium sp.]|nr:hypothetical protein [Eubacterium sp.]
MLSDEVRKELEKLADIKSERALISESEAFASGFALGARMMLEVMENGGSIQQ